MNGCVFVLQLGDQVDGLIVIFDLENLGMHHLWKPGSSVPLLFEYKISFFCMCESASLLIQDVEFSFCNCFCLLDE